MWTLKQICGTHGKPTDILNVDNEDDAAAFRRLAPQKRSAWRDKASATDE